MATGQLPLWSASTASSPTLSDTPTRTMESTERHIWAGDNLEMLAAVESGSARLVYLDPPFNSGRAYEAVLGVSATGDRGGRAFGDSWRWNDEAEAQLADLAGSATPEVADILRALISLRGRSDLCAYLVMLAPRLVEARRTLADEGALFLHCDPSASHYLKVLLDVIFGPDGFRNEIVWKRTHAHSGSRRFGPVHDVILFYARSSKHTWNQLYAPYSEIYIEKYFRHSDAQGRYQLITCTAPGPRPGTRAHYEWRGVWPPANRHWAWTEDVMEGLDADGRLVHSANGVPRLKRYVDDGLGTKLQDLWLDINPLGAHSAERTGYETQKPLAVLERIIEATTNEGDLVIDPFGGSGTTAIAAERLRRRWHVADTSLLAASLTLSRVRALRSAGRVELHGFPEDSAVARALRASDPTTYAVWGTAMLETLLDRDDTDPDLASGLGLWTSGGSSVQVTSWIPLTTRAQPRPWPHGCDKVVVLAADDLAAGLAGVDDAAAPVSLVDLQHLTSPSARRAGTSLVGL